MVEVLSGNRADDLGITPGHPADVSFGVGTARLDLDEFLARS